ncbi:MAG: phosphohistidine phosphatase SixA [Defluviicoccus sp.]|nr:phosphohistidine phosphatase SixA [Defluviicoccus sp.]
MRLYLVQHGEALPETVDRERRLSERGRADVARMAAFLGAAGVRVARVYESGKTRAHETATILAEKIAPGVPPKAVAGLAPSDPIEQTLSELAIRDEDVMLVGHLPFMGRLASMLVSGRDDPPVFEFEPGTVVCLERIEEGLWAAAWMLRPELLGEQ